MMQFTFDSMIDSQINFDTILSHFTQWAGGTQAFDWLIFVQNHGWQGRGGYKFLTEKIYSGEEILRSVLPRSDYNFTLDIHERYAQMNLSDHDRMGQLFTFHPLYYAVLDEKTGKHVTGKRIGNRHNYAAILSPQRKPALWASEDEAWIDTDRLFDPNRKYNVDFIIFNEEGFKVLDVKRTIF